MSTGSCAKHGPQDDWAGVCLAIGDALVENRLVGFVWGVDGSFRWAICDKCDSEYQQGLERSHPLVPLCQSCFDEAWALNGKPERLLVQ